MSRRIRIGEARVLITGAGSGIGRAAALRCAKAGAEVLSVDIDAEAAAETARRCTEAGSAAHAHVCDVADAQAVQELCEMVEEEHGAVDVLVNNAGVGIGGPFLEGGLEDWDWLMGINLHGVAYGCRVFGARMLERRRGHVVNIASGAAYIITRDLAAYCASKAAVLALTRCLRAEWAGSGVGISAICPGVINTPIASHARLFGTLAERQARFAGAMGRGHSPDLVARAIVRAVEQDLAVVPVGLESELAYRLLPFVPGRVQGLLARTPVGRLI